MTDTNSIVEECKRLKTSGSDDQHLAEFLRKSGCSKVQAIAILSRATGMSIGHAKLAVHNSAAWSDVREQDDDFHESLAEHFGQD